MNITDKIIQHSESVLNGKQEQVKLALTALLARGHVLIEDVPGVGKTTMVKMLAELLGLVISRIQFTNDILPSDIIGSSIFIKDDHSFKFQPGPIFGELILADELNRAPAKTQSALLQAMEEHKVSVDNQHYDLSPFFTVFATQNPHHQIGTYELPESQLDRFALKFALGYPEKSESLQMLKSKSISTNSLDLKKVLSKEEIDEARKRVESMHVDDSLYEYIYDLLNYTRAHKQTLPLSNRCGIDLVKTSKAWAFIQKRDYVICDDIQYLFPFVAGHRLVVPGQSSMEEVTKLSQSILSHVPVRK